MKKLLCLGLTVLATLGATTPIHAADTPEKKTNPDKAIPYTGKLTAVDASAKTITVGERVFHVTTDTKIMRDEKTVALDDGKVGEQVRGQYKSAESGQLSAVSVYFGAKQKAKKTEEK